MSDDEIPDIEEQDSKDEDYHEEEDLEEQKNGNDSDDDDVAPDDDDDDDDDDEEEEETEEPVKPEEEEVVPEEKPVKRKRGRPPGSGKKKPPKTNRTQPVQVPSDADGKPFAIEGDESMSPEDPKGEEKVDKLGFLKGGREFRSRTFHILGKGQRQYMSATEPARCIGFRDSYSSFQRHRKSSKVKSSEEEKFDLIDREVIPHSYKGRTLGVVTARSIFREFGARVVVGGRRVVDDYYEEQAIAEGHTPNEIADPDDYVPPEGISYDRNQYCAWYNAPQHVDSAAIYESNSKSVSKQQTSNGIYGAGGAGQGANAGQLGSYAEFNKPDAKLVHASSSSASKFNTHSNRGRIDSMARANYTLTNGKYSGGIVDPHTGVRFVSKITQPGRSRVEKVSKRAPRGAVMFTTVMDMHSVHTNSSSIDPSVYAEADEATRRAIAIQIAAERRRY